MLYLFLCHFDLSCLFSLCFGLFSVYHDVLVVAVVMNGCCFCRKALFVDIGSTWKEVLRRIKKPLLTYN